MNWTEYNRKALVKMQRQKMQIEYNPDLIYSARTNVHKLLQMKGTTASNI
jgi:hypothetical protein